ncbi:MAG TPA: 3-isopropylmalate dehydratase small subunit [Streptosporangiaceae bacterium]|nr:3-isopropylmalate dehydratase small subunit [Streptosporangiaceae bacterium]
MAGIQQVTGRAVALERRDVDTDQIIPAAWLKRVERTGFAPGLFGAWRENPDFVLNRPGADQAKVLVAGTNFGCGSSREHAVWALQDFGFQAVVSARFADIFRGNCVSSGLVPVEIDEKIVSMLFDALRDDPDATVVVDVAGRTIGIPSADISEPFALADYAQWRLLEGLDDVALTLRHEDAITAFEAGRPAWLPAVTPNAPAPA